LTSRRWHPGKVRVTNGVNSSSLAINYGLTEMTEKRTTDFNLKLKFKI
jgi:hypothetical protein